MQVAPSVVKSVQAAHPAATQVPPLAVAAVGQNCLSVPPSVAQVVSVAATHKPGLAGAAVKPVQSLLQSVEQRLVPEQKFLLPSAAQVVASGTAHVAASAVKPVQVAHPAATQVPPLAEAPEGQNCLSVPPSVAQVVSSAATHKPGLAGAAVAPVQSLQSVEQRLVPEQKFLLPPAVVAQVFASFAITPVAVKASKSAATRVYVKAS